MEENQGLLLKATLFASVAHQYQKRKNTKQTPYINHPIEVATIMSQSGIKSADVLVAGLLHDVVEDTSVTLEEIKEEFGPFVARIVELCSDDKSLDKVERKKLQIVHAKHMAENEEFMYVGIGQKIDVNKCAISIKLADKFSNVFGLITDPPSFWSRDEIKGYIVWAYFCTLQMKGFYVLLDKRLTDVFNDCFKCFEIDVNKLDEALEYYYTIIDNSD